MARIQSNEDFVADFFNLPKQQAEVAAMTSRPTSHQERVGCLKPWQKAAALGAAALGVLGLGLAADRALDNLAERQSPPADWDTDHRPTIDEFIDNVRTEGDVSLAELSQTVEDFYEQR